jgi:hypothetical protein
MVSAVLRLAGSAGRLKHINCGEDFQTLVAEEIETLPDDDEQE